MNIIDNLMFSLMGNDVEQDYNVLLTYDKIHSRIEISKRNIVYLEIGIMDFHSPYEENYIEIINYEIDEIYDNLNINEAFLKLQSLMFYLCNEDEEI